MPAGCSLFGVIRNGLPTPLRADTVLAEGDKVIAIGRADCEIELREQLIGEPAESTPARHIDQPGQLIGPEADRPGNRALVRQGGTTVRQPGFIPLTAAA